MKYLILIMIILFVSGCGNPSQSNRTGTKSKPVVNKLEKTVAYLTPSLTGCNDVKIEDIYTSDATLRLNGYSSHIKVIAWKAKCNFKTYYCSITIMAGSNRGGVATPICSEKKEDL